MATTGGLELRLDLNGETLLRRRIEGLLDNVEDLSPAMRQIADHFHQHMEDVFLSEGGATAHGQWKSLDAQYALWKARYGPSRSMLRYSDRLMNSLTSGGAAGAIEDITKDSLTVGTAVQVGAWNLGSLHQGGTKRMPQRRIIDPPEAVKERWMGFIRDHVWSE